MHGIIFASFFDYVRTALGSSSAATIFDQGFYSMSESHPDDEFMRLLGRTSAALSTPIETVLHDFGVYTGEQTFPRLYPSQFEIAGDTRSFLLTVEDRIHELVRATIPDADPPALTVMPVGESQIDLTYASPRRLCRLLEGLVVGTARHYDEEVEITEATCMHDGAPSCKFEAQFLGQASAD